MASPTTNTEAINLVLRNKSNYYAMIGVDNKSPDDVIKRAYKKMALRCHPDKNPDNARAVEAFKLLSKANDVLMDPAKRRLYDRGGEQGVLHGESGGGGGGGFGGNPYARRGGAQYHYANQGEMFEDFIFQAFGGGRRPGGPRQGHPRGGANVEFEGNIGLMMLIPLVLFILLSSFLSSAGFDGPSSTRTRGGNSRGSSRGPRVQPFDLVPNQQQGFVVPRVTNLRGYPGLRVEYYVRSDFENLLMHGQVDVYNTELGVLKTKKASLARRCNAQNMRDRRKGGVDGENSVCREHQRFHRVPS